MYEYYRVLFEKCFLAVEQSLKHCFVPFDILWLQLSMFVFQAVKVLKMNTRIVMTVRFFPYGMYMYYKSGYTSMQF